MLSLAVGLSGHVYRHEVGNSPGTPGRRAGYHARAGLFLSLQAFKPRRADWNRQTYGLLGSGMILEARYARVDDFGGATINLGAGPRLGA